MKYPMRSFCFFLTLFIFLNASYSQSFSFTEEEIIFYNGTLKISGTLFIPASNNKLPAIAVTQGSGKEGRKSQGNRSFASALAKQGYIILIYDKRGVGDADGQYIETPDMNVPAGDLVEAVRFLKKRTEADPNRIGVYGHSQGGWVAPLAAVICRDINFVVITCGGAVSVREQVLYNQATDLKKQGYSDSIINLISSFGHTLYSYLGSGENYANVNKGYAEAVKQPWFAFFKQMSFGAQLPPPSFLSNPAFNFFKALTYDPQSTLRFLEIPVFVALAENDQTVPSLVAKRNWEQSFKASGHESLLHLVIIPGEVHPAWERKGEQVIYKESYLNAISTWLREKIPVTK
jgi:pimeloyl-ACP methyl ester carboxylesterase